MQKLPRLLSAHLRRICTSGEIAFMVDFIWKLKIIDRVQFIIFKGKRFRGVSEREIKEN